MLGTALSSMTTKSIEQVYRFAQERYANLGIDTERALGLLASIPVSMHCWQGDDVGGFESADRTLGDGLAVTGNYPGKARTPHELRADFERAISLIPGTKRFNIHASYAELGGQKVDRDSLSRDHAIEGKIS
jgi:L-rhamnose isomerase